MLKIAITGNIGSGKSTLQEIIENEGYKTLCLDKITAEIYTRENFKIQLKKFFGVDTKCEIAKIVFSNNAAKNKLEKLIYPEIEIELKKFFNENDGTVFVCAPMLFEAEFDKFFDKIIFVSCSEKIRLERIIKRNGYSKKEAGKRIKAQEAENIKILKSDYVIYNDKDKNWLVYQAKEALRFLL